MGNITLLSKDLINQIAAGEVIERPASVVKELIENALDAAATSISVQIEGAGIGLIRVVDNGMGMDQDDLAMSIQRHATSKIRDVSDLFAIRTLGFRGEALPSITSVSRTTLATRTAASPHGYFITMEAGEVVERGKRGMPPGTIVEVKDIFFNTPARRKFLKTAATEQKNILDAISRSALSYPSIAFAVTIDGRQVMNLKEGLSFEERSGILLGIDFRESMREFSNAGSWMYVHGALAGPEVSRPTRSSIYTFVNTRSVRDKILATAVIGGFKGMLMKNRYPVTVLFVDIDPANVDVNVHPAKAEVRFRDPSRVFGFIVATIKAALLDSAKAWHHMMMPASAAPIRTQGVRRGPDYRSLETSQERLFRKTPSFYTDKTIVGNLKSTYILLEDDEALYILDQHASHERILYERLKDAHGSTNSQILLHPLVIELTPGEFAVFEEIVPVLQETGIDCASFGETSIAVRALPSVLNSSDMQDIIRTVIQDVSHKVQTDYQNVIRSTIACHKSLRSGKTLTYQEIVALLKALDEIGAPLTCPHGRPLFKKISIDQIEKWIGRRG